MDKTHYLNNNDLDAIDQLYQNWLQKPESVDPQWQRFFEGFEFARRNFSGSSSEALVFDTEFKVINLIESYRKRGHLFTRTNPVRARRNYSPNLAPENFGLSETDMDTQFRAGKSIGLGHASLREIIDHLETTYCRSIGAEYMFIRNPENLSWLQERMEPRKNLPDFSPEDKKQIYQHLVVAVGFEQFIHKKFIGQKRFSLEGAEAVVPALNGVIEHGSTLGIDEFVIGMAHRGRLNILANILKKPYEAIFAEFMASDYDDSIALGDVKYHLGYSQTVDTDSGKQVRLHLVPNPSHLETVNPVVQGLSRALTDHQFQGKQKKLAPILIHGDAAFAGQGIVYEVIQMSALPGYQTGGTIHLIINNQVGFTTNYMEARSSTYCTDIGKVTKAPIFHVNGDDAEALLLVIRLAVEYRQQFHSDVIIDLLCYRKYGHNEGDEPRFTQPTLYKAIANHANPRDQYGESLIKEGLLKKEELLAEQKKFNDLLEEKLLLARKSDQLHIDTFLPELWQHVPFPEDVNFDHSPETGVMQDKLDVLAGQINHIPDEKLFFRKLVKLVQQRHKQYTEGVVDWATGELLAYASLLEEGHPVRVSGQDSERGTFSHRHAAFVMEDSGEKYIPLANLSPEQAPFTVYNSPLNEYGVLGFEYGYALGMPEGLTIWEAQFGDFNNVGQAIIDQYISSAEEKWGMRNGLTLFLPHGYEGQGPEHSSARMERFLLLAANNNMIVSNPTTPASLFHLLRRQVKQSIRLPLIVFTPKSLLRHPECTSKPAELANGSFREVIDDADNNPEKVLRVVFCTGKIYYDLLARKKELQVDDIALIRLEQLHPFPKKQVQKILNKYTNALLHLWVQEEPENMGAWWYMREQMKDYKLIPVARIPSGSPAVGLNKLHVLGQEEIINKVFRKCTCELKNKYCGLQCVEGKSRQEILKQHYYLSNDAKFSI